MHSLSQNKISGLKKLPALLWLLISTRADIMGGLIVLTLVAGGIPAAELWILKHLLDELITVTGLGSEGFFQVLPWVWGLAGLLLASTLIDMVRNVLQTDIQERLSIRLQHEVVEKVKSVELAWFEHPEFYDKLQRANEDMSGRLLTLQRLALDMIYSAIALSSIAAMLSTGHWSLMPIVIIGAVPGVWMVIVMNRKTHWVYRIRTPEYRQVMYLRQLLTNRDEAKEVRLFTLLHHLLSDWRTRNIDLAVERRRLEVKAGWLGGLSGILGGWAYSLCLAILGWIVAGGGLTIGTFGMLTRGVQLFYWRVESIMQSLARVHEQSLYLGDLFEFLELEVPAETPGGTDSESTRDDIDLTLVFEDVSFRYPGADHDVLREISITIQPGERLALVGENGAGKTTLVKLMMGLYQPTEGRIMLGGKPLDAWPKDLLRDLFSAVFQDFVKYQFPVNDNIGFGALESRNDHNIVSAAEMAGAAKFIESLPEKYETMLGKPLGGEDLSIGQWQKLATARALIRDARFIILDEPTAALDPKAEAEVYRNFSEMTQGKTALLISHRLGSARIADRILVLKDGALIEQGSHEDLVAKNGEYGRLFALQAQWYQ
ncbi:MAG: ABC transporter ATP-binding protein [Gemmatimonadota bacterium]|nr:ABC transporter ATP-binding protein [Gemmatimonadota bacterium]